jgi:putative sigma-54 modulation protein
MQKIVTARHFDLTDEMREQAESEMDGLTRYFENIISAELVLDLERHIHKAELRVKVFNHNITGTGETDDMYNSISVSVDKVKVQLKKYKGKLKERRPEEINETINELTKPHTEVDDIDQ